MPASCWVGPGLGTKSKREEPKQWYGQHCLPCRISHWGGHCQCLCPQGELQETLQDLPVGLAQASIKFLLPPWVPAQDVLCVPYKSGISVSSDPEGLMQLSTADLQMLSGLIFWCQTPRPGSLMWGSELLLLWDNLCTIIILQFVGHLWGKVEEMKFDYIESPPLLLLLNASFVCLMHSEAKQTETSV